MIVGGTFLTQQSSSNWCSLAPYCSGRFYSMSVHVVAGLMMCMYVGPEPTQGPLGAKYMV